MRSALSVIATILMIAISAFAAPKRHIEAFVLPYVYPLLDAGDTPIQWIVPHFSGSYDPGDFDGAKRNPCKGAKNCYWFDGKGNWRFNFTGLFACLNTCSFVGTGKLTEHTVTLPGGSFTKKFGATLTGTFLDENGAEWKSITAYYDCDLVATNLGELTMGNTLAAGSLDIILAYD